MERFSQCDRQLKNDWGFRSPMLSLPHIEVVCFHWSRCIFHSIYTVMPCFCLEEQVWGVEAPVLACDPVCQQFIMLYFHFFFFIPEWSQTGQEIPEAIAVITLSFWIWVINWWSIPWKYVHMTLQMDTYYYFMALTRCTRFVSGNLVRFYLKRF